MNEDEQCANTAQISQNQVQETVEQEVRGITVRMATVTCPCGMGRALVKSYQCLYCKVWFCDSCAETHFGKTVSQYREHATFINRFHPNHGRSV